MNNEMITNEERVAAIVELLEEAKTSEYNMILFDEEYDPVFVQYNSENDQWEVSGDFTPFTEFETLDDAATFISNRSDIQIDEHYIPGGPEDVRWMEIELGWTF